VTRLASDPAISHHAWVSGLLWVWTVAALIAGATAGGGVRAAVFHYAVKAGEPWRTSCPACDGTLVRLDVPLTPAGSAE